MSIKDYIIEVVYGNLMEGEADPDRTFYSYAQEFYPDPEKNKWGYSFAEYEVLDLLDDMYEIYSIADKTVFDQKKFFTLTIDKLSSYIEKEAKKVKAAFNGDNYERKRWSYGTRLMTRNKLKAMQEIGTGMGIPVKSYHENNYGEVFYRSDKFVIKIYDSDKKLTFSSIDDLDRAGYVVD